MSATITTSIITGGSNSHATTSYELNAFATDFVGQGVVGSIANTLGVSPATGSFAVNAQGTPAMLVDVTAGSAWITATPSGQASQALRAYMSATYTSYAISSNASGSTKFDWIYLKVDPTKAGGTEDSAADDVTALYTSRSSSNTADNNAPPTYGILLAVVTVANGASSITNANIKDGRTQATPSAQLSTTGSGWTSSTAPTSCTALGNRSYQVVFNATDLTGTLSPGMKIKTTRTIAPPTQCTSLNGSSQYFTRASASINGMAFTNNFVVSAWVKLSSYAAGTIASRYNGTSGWVFQINASGQLQLLGLNSGAANFRGATTQQSIPLNKWVHVAMEIDMLTHTLSATTDYAMFDGVDVPCSLSTGGTNPTSLIQAGNLEVGSQNGGTSLFPGKIAQVAIYNAKVTQANILATISQTMSGAETSTISVYTFNGVLTDSNANGNTLSIGGGAATATNADSPFSNALSSGLDYGIITAASFSTNTTLTVQVPEGYALPTTGGISALSYSTHAVPYGFPKQHEKWTVEMHNKTDGSQSSPTAGVWYNIAGMQLNLPIGAWELGYEGTIGGYKNASAELYFKGTLSTANNSESDPTFSTSTDTGAETATTVVRTYVSKRRPLSVSTATIYYANFSAGVAASAELDTEGATFQPWIIKAECAYL